MIEATAQNDNSTLIGLYLIFSFILWVWALVDLFKMNRQTKANITPWLILIILFPVVGSIVYFQFGKSRLRESKQRSFDPQFNRT